MTYASFMSTFDDAVSRFFRIATRKIVRCPVLTILLFSLLPIIFGVLLGIYFNTEDDVDKLFFQQKNQSTEDRTLYEGYWGPQNFGILIAQIYPEGKDPLDASTDVLNPSDVENLINIINNIRNVRAENVSLDTVCVMSSNNCNIFSVGGIYNQVVTSVPATKELILNKINNEEGLRDWNGVLLHGRIGELVGPLQKNAVGEITQAGAFRAYFLLNNNDDAKKWESAVVQAFSQSSRGMTVEVFKSNSLDEALEASQSGDIVLMSITFTIMCTYLALAHIRPKNPVQGQSLMGTLGVISTAFGIITGFGLAMVSGIPFIALAAVAPFLIIGIGIDDTFIILHEFSSVNPEMDPKERVVEAMANCGPSITMTTLTDVLALAIGASSVFPAIQYFCAYTALSLFFVFVFQCTITVAYLSFDAKRMRANRIDYAFCLKSKDPDAYKKPEEHFFFGPYYVVNKLLAPALSIFFVKIAIVIFFLVLVTISGWLAGTRLKIGLELQSLTLRDSPEYNFLDHEEKWFGDNSRTMSITVTLQNVNYVADSAKIDDLKTQLLQSEYSFNDVKQLSFWFDDFRTWSSGVGLPLPDDASLSNSVRNNFLVLPEFEHYQQDLNPESGAIQVSRFTFLTKPITSFRDQGLAMKEYRQIVKNHELGSHAFPYNGGFFNFEQSLVIVPQTMLNLGVAALVVLVTTFLFLVIPWISLYVLLCIVMIDVDLFGMMALWNIPLDSVSMVNLIMSIGFAVDYSAHVAHSFMLAEGTRNERMKESLRAVGVSVFNGGLSTILATLPLSASKSYIFFTFFRMFFFSILFGLLHGLVFLPVLLSLIGPSPISRATHLATSRRADGKTIEPFGDELDIEEAKNIAKLNNEDEDS
eukprot:GHVL01017493.1.p1 GENE.GHVL01017493.1~~GHVL01017493.1.p1  ORF type:complete len:871 (+),score=76.06 GHVL01017493.1:82-2694(+)